jgi:hypothetical protein
MSVTRHLSVIITPFSGSSVWTFPRLSYKNSAFVKVFRKAFKTCCYNGTVFSCFHPPSERRLLRIGPLPHCTVVKRNAEDLNAYDYRWIVFVALFGYQNFLNHVKFINVKAYSVFVSLNVIRVAERKCEILQNFIQCSFVVFLTADMLPVFSSSILRVLWPQINFRTIPRICFW